MNETLRTIPKKAIEKKIGQKVDRQVFDPLFLKDSSEFLRLSIINLLCYKHVIGGKFLAWARVTYYYSQFYILNCLIRLKGFAVVHLNYVDNGSLTLRIEKVTGEPKYRINRCSTAHHYLWKQFADKFPELSSMEMGDFSIQERVDWNYDLFFASQTTYDHALKESEERWKHNFLDPNFEFSYTEGEADYKNQLMASFGYEEAGTGDYIKYAIEQFSEIGKDSPYKDWYRDFFESLLNDIDVLESKQEMKDEIKSWISSALKKMND